MDINKSNLSKETETTIAVNWSGGGSIKNPKDDWGIDTLKMAAAAFPECVAITPQRTYAILTKYTALESFHRQNTEFKPLDYENAGIYTGALLDAYMDYKSLWKQISHATYELEGKRATVDRGEPSEEMVKLAIVCHFPLTNPKDDAQSETKQVEEEKPRRIADSASTTRVTTTGELKPSNDPEENQIHTFEPTFAGLISARKTCRFEMSKIVREVDLVAHDPTLSTDPTRDRFFLHPLVFKQLLPASQFSPQFPFLTNCFQIVRSLSPENAALQVRDPSATLLLGYSQPKSDSRVLSRVYILSEDLKEHSLPLRKSIEKLAYKAQDYRTQGCVGLIANSETVEASFFNDLEKLDQTYRPIEIAFWAIDDRLNGIRLQYASTEMKTHGLCDGTPSHVLSLKHDGSEIIVEIAIRGGIEEDSKKSWIQSIAIATSTCNVLDTSVPKVQTEKASKVPALPSSNAPTINKNLTSTPEGQDAVKTNASAETKPAARISKSKITTWTRPDDPRYSLRGLFGFETSTSIETLGVVLGKDSFVPVPAASISPPFCQNYLSLTSDLRDNIRGHLSHAGNLFLGASISTSSRGKSDYFNAMDVIDTHWEIKTIGFASNGGRLCGLKVGYLNGKELNHGVTEGKVKWTCEVQSELSIVRLTAGKVEEDTAAYIDTVELIRGDAEGNIPLWPLHMSTLRYLGEGDVRVSNDVVEVTEAAPKFGNVKVSTSFHSIKFHRRA